MPRPAKSGKPKGFKAVKTLEKEAAREVVRAFVTAHMMPMLRAQLANATGIGHLFVRDKLGQFSRVLDPDRIEELMREGRKGKTYWIFAKDPSVEAMKHLLDRALDKAKEQEIDVNVRGEAELVARLAAARARVQG